MESGGTIFGFDVHTLECGLKQRNFSSDQQCLASAPVSFWLVYFIIIPMPPDIGMVKVFDVFQINNQV